MFKFVGLSVLLGLALVTSCGQSDPTVVKPGPAKPTAPVVVVPEPTKPTTPGPGTGNSAEFTATVQPAFQVHCVKCHTADSGLPVDFLTSEAAAKGKALAEINAGKMPQGAANLKAFASVKASIVTILSK